MPFSAYFTVTTNIRGLLFRVYQFVKSNEFDETLSISTWMGGKYPWYLDLFMITTGKIYISPVFSFYIHV